jgi:hypothetical protein
MPRLMPRREVIAVQRGLTADNAFMEHTFHVDLLFGLFLVVMTLLFVLFGIALDSGSFLPVNYETFW